MALKIRVHEKNKVVEEVKITDLDPSQVVKDIFAENELYYEWYWDFKTGNLCVIVDGDWRHDHMRLDYIMQDNGFTPVSVEYSGKPTDGDWYEATRIYKKPAVMKKVSQ